MTPHEYALLIEEKRIRPDDVPVQQREAVQDELVRRWWGRQPVPPPPDPAAKPLKTCVICGVELESREGKIGRPFTKCLLHRA